MSGTREVQRMPSRKKVKLCFSAQLGIIFCSAWILKNVSLKKLDKRAFFPQRLTITFVDLGMDR